MCLFTVLYKPLVSESGQNVMADESVVGLIEQWILDSFSIAYKIENWTENGFRIQFAV